LFNKGLQSFVRGLTSPAPKIQVFHSLWMYPMNRCSRFIVLSSFGLGVLLSAAHAQLSEPLPVNEQAVTPGTRKFPANALRGKLQVGQAPDVRIDGRADRLSPGSRIRDLQNRIVLPGNLVGQELIVNFTRTPTGEVHDVWILTDAEIKQKIKTNTPERNFVFASEGNTSKQDDGKTPFKQLPTFEELGRQQRDPQKR
jgi:hypothetical protein